MSPRGRRARTPLIADLGEGCPLQQFHLCLSGGKEPAELGAGDRQLSQQPGHLRPSTGVNPEGIPPEPPGAPARTNSCASCFERPTIIVTERRLAALTTVIRINAKVEEMAGPRRHSPLNP